MPHAQRSDAELVADAIAGDGAAFTMLFRRHVDTVHDHLVRWTRDPRLAADATLVAFTTLMGSLGEIRDGRTVLAWLLRTARNRAVDELRGAGASVATPPGLTAALLAVSPARAGSEQRVAEATDVGSELLQLVGQLDERALSVLDLTARAGLSITDVASVLGSSYEETQLVTQRLRRRADGTRHGADASLRAYAALADVRAPAGLRAAIEVAIDERWAPPHPHHRWWLPIGVAAALLLVVLGSVRALVSGTPDTPPVATAVALDAADLELVDGSSSEDTAPAPTDTRSDEAEDPSELLEAVDTPSAPPEATPSEAPRTEPVALVVSVESPITQSSFRTGPPVSGTPSVAAVPLRASVTGANPSSDALEIAWRSSVRPDAVLLSTLTGQVMLSLSAPCTDTVHGLTITVTDPETDAVSSDSVSVLVEHDCPPPPTVRVTAPADGTTVTSTGVGLDRRRNADVAVASSSDTDDGSFRYRWSSDRAPTTLLLDAASGTVQLWSETCDPLVHVLTVQVTDPRTQQTGTASIRVTVDPECTVE